MHPKFHDDTYLKLMADVIANGQQKSDRTGTGTISLFDGKMEFDISEFSIPLLTTKQMHTKSIIHELLWYLKGESNIAYLKENGVRIWDEWADENGDLGPLYPTQWRNCPRVEGSHIDYETDPPTAVVDTLTIDQVDHVIFKLKNNPDDRRIIISAWNVGQIPDMNLPPCHAFVQFYSRELSLQERNKLAFRTGSECIWDHDEFNKYGIPARALSCKLYQRSADVFLGVPFNIAQYSIFTHMIAHVTGHVAEKFIWTGGDVHIYDNHLDQCYEQMTRDPYPSPRIQLSSHCTDIDDFTFDDFKLIGYDKFHPTIKAKVAV